MERENLVKAGDVVKVSDGYARNLLIEPAVAMSRNYKFPERIKSKSGTVIGIDRTDRGFFVKVEFNE